MAKKLEELTAYQKAVEFAEAVIALLDRPAFRKDRKLHDQISDANDSITSNIAEGFEQPTDRSFAHYLFIAKGSLAEVCTRLRQARLKRHLTADELTRCLAMGEVLAKMLANFIRYLAQSDYKDRGRFKLGPTNSELPENHTNQEPEDQGIKDQRTKDQRPRDQGTKGPRDQGTKGPRTKDQGPRTKDQGLRTRDQGPGTRGTGD